MATFVQVRNSWNLNKGNSVFGYNMTVWLVLLTFTLCADQGISVDYCRDHFTRCICTDDYVKCHNAGIKDMRKILHYIRDNVKEVLITGDNFTELPKSVLGSCKHDSTLLLLKLVKLDLSSNKIERIHAKAFHCMPNLEVLVLRNNNWRHDLYEQKIGYFTSLPNLRHLDLTNAFQEVWNGSIHMTKLSSIFKQTDMSVLETLKLGYNELYSFSVEAANIMCELTHLKSLDLTHNNLVSPSLPTIPDCLEELETLDLSHNKVKRLPQEFLDKVSKLTALKSVKLGGNPFKCDCGLLDTWYWLNKTELVPEKSGIVCEDGFRYSYIGKPVLSIQPAELKCTKLEFPSNCSVIGTILTDPRLATGITFVVVGLTLAACLIVNRDQVKRICKRWSKRIPKVNFRCQTGYKRVRKDAFVDGRFPLDPKCELFHVKV